MLASLYPGDRLEYIGYASMHADHGQIDRKYELDVTFCAHRLFWNHSIGFLHFVG